MTVFRGGESKIRNVVLLVVDMLKFDFLEKGGDSLNLCPTLNSLADNSITCLNAYSTSYPTQLSHPSIFTSTLPLDYGGYDNGIFSRPLTIAEALSDLGCHTIGYSTTAWLSRFYGYDRGFGEFYELFDINVFWGIFAEIYYEYYRNLLAKKRITCEEQAMILGDLFERAFNELLRLCEQASEQLAGPEISYDVSLHRHDFAKYKEILQELRGQLLQDRKKFIREKLYENMPLDIKTYLTGEKDAPGNNDVERLIFCIAKKVLQAFGVKFRSSKRAIPAAYLRKLINKKISDNKNNRFFIWSHFMDVHDRVCVSNTFGFPPDLIPLTFRRVLSRASTTRKKDVFPLRYIDNEIAKVLEKLKSENLLDSTLVVVCGDHGVGSKAFETKAGALFDEATHVSLIISNPNLNPHVITSPCSLIDLAPTILSLMGAPSRPEFQGQSLIENLNPNRHILLESLGNGPGNLKYKAIKIAVIKGKYKLIWREEGYEDSCPAGINYLFNLDSDPKECHNLYNDGVYKSVVSELEKIALERCRTIRNKAGI